MGAFGQTPRLGAAPDCAGEPGRLGAAPDSATARTDCSRKSLPLQNGGGPAAPHRAGDREKSLLASRAQSVCRSKTRATQRRHAVLATATNRRLRAAPQVLSAPKRGRPSGAMPYRRIRQIAAGKPHLKCLLLQKEGDPAALCRTGELDKSLLAGRTSSACCSKTEATQRRYAALATTTNGRLQAAPRVLSAPTSTLLLLHRYLGTIRVGERKRVSKSAMRLYISK